jgi:hypothetical protein
MAGNPQNDRGVSGLKLVIFALLVLGALFLLFGDRGVSVKEGTNPAPPNVPSR